MAKLSDKAYIIPVEPEPENDVCIRVYVPDDPLYIAAFWASYEFLTAWLAWERDEAHTAKIVASRWKSSFLKAREQWICAEGSCGLMDVRQKPDEDCTLQKLNDCTDEWVDFANLQLCAPKLRFTGTGTIEQWNGTDWVPVAPDSGTGPPYQPGHDISNQQSLWENPPAGQNGSCLAAANAVAFLEAAINAQMTQLKELPLLVRLVDSFAAWWFYRIYGMSAFVWNNVLSLVFDVHGQFFGLSWEQGWTMMQTKSMLVEDDIIAYDIRDDALCMFFDAYESDGNMTEASFNTLMNSIQDEASDRTGAEALKWEWLMLLAYVGPTWLANISNDAGIDEYDCDVCGWTKCWDFTAGNGDWNVQQDTENRWPNVDLGVWSGSGWAGVAVSPPDGYRCLSIRIAPSELITLTSVDGFVALGGGTGVRNCAVLAYRGGGWNLLFNKTDATNETVHQTWSGSLDSVEEIWIEIEGFYSSILQTSICVKGSLPEPESWE
jgi:hypothetical protein